MANQFQYSTYGGTGFGTDGSWGWGIGYDAVQNKGRRKIPSGRVLSEDWELRELPRRQLLTTHRDLDRNFAVVAWAIRRHLDYVSSFHFRAHTGDTILDQELNDWTEWWALPENCDLGGRHDLFDLLRMWEARSIVDGDVLTNNISNGTIQTIEGDRIQSFGGIPYDQLKIDPNWVINGVYVEPLTFRALQYMIFKRPPNWTGLLWDTALSAQFADLHAYYQRYDQVRGISPIAAAANTFRDVYEGADYALAKMKISQLFGLNVFREGSENIGNDFQEPSLPNQPGTAGGVDDELDPRSESLQRFFKDMGRGPAMLDLDSHDRVEVLESKTPSNEFREFMKSMLMLSLKSLDLPFSFYDESHTNWIGQRQANIIYEKSVKIKRRRLRNLAFKKWRWRMGLAIMDRQMSLPKGMTPQNVPVDFIPDGIPWVNPLQEVSADVAAVNAGFKSQEGVCSERGVNVYDVIDQRAAVEAYAKSKNVILLTALASVAQDDPNKGQTAKEDVAVDEKEAGQKPDPQAKEDEKDDDDTDTETSDDDKPAKKQARPDHQRAASRFANHNGFFHREFQHDLRKGLIPRST